MEKNVFSAESRGRDSSLLDRVDIAEIFHHNDSESTKRNHEFQGTDLLCVDNVQEKERQAEVST